jgi:hypothetical protein
MTYLKSCIVAVVLVSAVTGMSSMSGNSAWQHRFHEVLPEYGHRNWIVIADAAYPKQSAPGIETIATGKGQFEVLEVVFKAIDKAPHVQPIVMLDAELKSVAPADAPEPEIGINDVLIKVGRTGICGTDVHIYKWDAWAQATIPVQWLLATSLWGRSSASDRTYRTFAVEISLAGKDTWSAAAVATASPAGATCAPIRKESELTVRGRSLSIYPYR